MRTSELDRRVGEAIKLFWQTRSKQGKAQGMKTGRKDAGLRAAVTGGKHLDGFTQICRDLIVEGGVAEAHVYWNKKRELPGFFRAEKNWDLLVVADGELLAAIEVKAQVRPSFGNNFNNRTEEALGNATDLWAAYREGAFKPSVRPWLGYVFANSREHRCGSSSRIILCSPSFTARRISGDMNSCSPSYCANACTMVPVCFSRLRMKVAKVPISVPQAN